MPRKTNTNLTAEALREVLSYSAETGIFRWKIRASTRRGVGDVAGYKMRTGYICVAVNKRYFLAHRLAWLYVNGSWPTEEIDHIDGARDNNAILNLREATHTENQRNRTHTRGYRKSRDKFRAHIVVDGHQLDLGSFDTAADARAAYVSASEIYFGEFAPHKGAQLRIAS